VDGLFLLQRGEPVVNAALAVRTNSMKYCSNPHCPGRQQNDHPAQYLDSADVCLDCGGSLTVNEPLIRPSSPDLRKRAFVSAGVLAVCLVARRIVLPTVMPNADFGHGNTAGWSIMALGVWPLILGYMFVEFAALLVPDWRPLRVGGSAGRDQLRRAALMVGMLIALGQAVVFAVWLESSGVPRNYGGGFRVITVLTLLGATAALVALARLVDHEGLGSGFSILLLAEFVPQTVGRLGDAFGAAPSSSIPFSVFFHGVLFASVLAGLTLWMFSPLILPSSRGDPHPSLLSRPACGVAPFTTVMNILVGAAAVTRLSRPGHALNVDSSSYLPTALLMSVGAAVLFAFLFNRPDRIAVTWKSLSPNPREGIPRLKPVLLECVLFSVVVFVADWWFVQRMGGYAPNTVATLLVTGIVCDLVREWRANEGDLHLTPVWEIHQMYAVTPALRLLEAEGIRAFAKGARLRALLQFFGPYVPVLILVPAKDAPRAHALLQARWPRTDGDGHQ
jgi:hypothetical protein